MKKLDYMLIGIYFVLAMGIFWFSFQHPSVEDSYVEIYLDNTLWGTYELPSSGYRDIVVKGRGENTIRISHDGVCVLHSNCKGQLCVHQGWIYNSRSVIACVPNGLLVQIVSADSDDLDMVSY